MTHSFDCNIAKSLDGHIQKAILLKEIFWWCCNNAKNKINIKNDIVWTYSSASELSNKFPYMSSSSISRWLGELEKDKWIISDNFNKKGYDRTKWYSINFERYKNISNGLEYAISQNDKWTSQSDKCISQSDESISQNDTPIPTLTNYIKKEESLEEKPSFDKRINLQLPFDVTSSSETIRATYQKPFLDLKEDLKNIYQIEVKDSDIEQAIFTFSTVAVARFDKYQRVRDYEKLCNLFKEWITFSLKYESNKPKEKPQDLETYLLQFYKERDIKNAKENGDFGKWEKLLSDNLFRIKNISEGYKSQNVTPLFVFEFMYLKLGNNLSGMSADKRLESFKKLFDKQNEYNRKFGNFREIIEAYGKSQRH